MTARRFAATPQPPYVAVMFVSQRTAGDNGYGAMAERMETLVREQPGFLGLEHARDAGGFGITLAYFRTHADVAAWKAEAEHREAQRLGHERWYEHFELRIADVTRAYSGPATRG